MLWADRAKGANVKNLLKTIIDRCFDRQLGLRVRIFNVLAMAGVLVSTISAVMAGVLGDPAWEVLMYASFAVLSGALISYSTKTGRYQICYKITIILIFLIGFPIFFWSGGAYYGAMPYFFVFAVVFTIFMVEGRAMFGLAALELAVYVGLCVCAYYFFEPDPQYLEKWSRAYEAIFGFFLVSVVLGITMYIQIRMYNQQQRILAEQNAALDAANRMKTEFLGNVSHELKTPLTVISGYAQESRRLLADYVDAEVIRQNMQLIASEADRLALTISQVLDVTRIDENRMNFDMKPTYILRSIQSALQTYYPAFSKNNNILEIERDSSNSVVLCDPQRIAQVVVNLVANAMRHTYNGRIKIGVAEEDGFAEVSVMDNGEGISPERKENLFKRYETFAPKENARPGKETGTGLGLYICKYIVEGHGGSIGIESEPDKGTTVRFTIPMVEEG